MLDDRKRWIDATFKLIAYRRTLESLLNVDAEVFDMAVQAMRRQAPEKPKKELDWTDSCYKYYCPACGMFFGQRGKRSVFLFKRPPYCNCGQAIDWMEEETKKC